ncbi:MAG: hypothetical protein D6753_14385 [Planctomycetota bacterium]|nr:MAG: hypothetical protein D6753_14385 [Planctomycetota bacterium]
MLAEWDIRPDVLRDVVWHFRQYFGTSSCIGSPDGMSAYAEKSGRRWVRGQRRARVRFQANDPPEAG